MNKHGWVTSGLPSPHSPALLRGLDALLDAVDEVRASRADVRPEHVTAVALVVHTHGQLNVGV